MFTSSSISPRRTRRASKRRSPGRRPVGLARPATRPERRSPSSSRPTLARSSRAALPLLERVDDHAGLARVWDVLGHGVANFHCRFEQWAQAAEQAVHHFRLAGQHHSGLAGLSAALVLGPRPADEALRTLDSVLPANPRPSGLLRRAQLLAMLGRFDEAWALARPAAERARELGGVHGG